MFEKIRNLKNKKGFTLVELIVVLVILAILAALLVPALTGYIDKANKEKIVATTRQVVLAAQTEVSEAYGKAGVGTFAACDKLDADSTPTLDSVLTLAEVKGKITSADIKVSAKGIVESVTVVQDGHTCTYTQANGHSMRLFLNSHRISLLARCPASGFFIPMERCPHHAKLS